MKNKSVILGVGAATFTMLMSIVWGLAENGIGAETSEGMQILILFAPWMFTVGVYAYARSSIDSPKQYMLSVIFTDLIMFVSMYCIFAVRMADDSFLMCGFTAATLVICVITDLVCNYYENRNEPSTGKLEVIKTVILSSLCPIVGGLFAEKQLNISVVALIVHLLLISIFIDRKRLYLYLISFTYPLFATIGLLIADSLGWVYSSGFMNFSGLATFLFVLAGTYLLVPLEALKIFVIEGIKSAKGIKNY